MKNRLLTLAACSLLAVACKSAGDPADPEPMPTATGGSGGQSSTSMLGGSGGVPAVKTPNAGAKAPGTGGAKAPGTGGAQAPDGGTQPVDNTEPPFGTGADVFPWVTEEFTLETDQDRYLCFTKTLEEDLVINGYASDVPPFVHHLIFSRDSAPDPDGFSECDVAFRSSWEPVFISGAGDAKLELPTDAGHRLAKGTHLVVQMHLLNVTGEPVKGAVTINMRRSSAANPRPVSTFIFGTAAVELPAASVTEVVGTCSPWQSVHLIAGFPHMHMLGSSMRFEVGPSEAELKEVFKRDPFDFDDQHIDTLDVTVNAGDVTRVTCEFTNTLDQTVSYGESTRNEMCYFIGFAIDQSSQAACLEVLPPFGN